MGIDIVSKNKFGICPICHTKNILVRNETNAFQISETAWIQAELRADIKYTLICPKCKRKMVMMMTERGLEPVGYEGIPTQAPILREDITEKKVGFIKEE